MEKNLSKVLVVDDEQFICELLEEYLSLQGYLVLTSTNGEEALSIFKTQKPQLVILDISMPGGIGGLDILRRIKEMDSCAKIIMLSAFGDFNTVKETLQIGANHYMQKPVEFERLMKILTICEKSLTTGAYSENS